MKTDSSISTPSGQSDECEYAAYVRHDSVVIFENNYVEGCKRGVLYEDNSQGIARNNVLIGNARGGVRAIFLHDHVAVVPVEQVMGWTTWEEVGEP